jgi:hypothetical protein
MLDLERVLNVLKKTSIVWNEAFATITATSFRSPFVSFSFSPLLFTIAEAILL